MRNAFEGFVRTGGILLDVKDRNSAGPSQEVGRERRDKERKKCVENVLNALQYKVKSARRDRRL